MGSGGFGGNSGGFTTPTEAISPTQVRPRLLFAGGFGVRRRVDLVLVTIEMYLISVYFVYLFIYLWIYLNMFVCLFVDTITLERLNQSEPNFHTRLLTEIARPGSKMGTVGH